MVWIVFVLRQINPFLGLFDAEAINIVSNLLYTIHRIQDSILFSAAASPLAQQY